MCTFFCTLGGNYIFLEKLYGGGFNIVISVHPDQLTDEFYEKNKNEE